MLAAYNAMLDFIPRLKSLLPFQNDTDPEYFYKVVNAVRRQHSIYALVCALIILYRSKWAVVWPARKPSGESRRICPGTWQQAKGPSTSVNTGNPATNQCAD